MRYTEVESSTIDQIGYDRCERIMEIKFQSGALYRFWNISRYMRDALVKAESVGRFFSQRIRKFPDLYPYEKIG